MQLSINIWARVVQAVVEKSKFSGLRIAIHTHAPPAHAEAMSKSFPAASEPFNFLPWVVLWRLFLWLRTFGPGISLASNIMHLLLAGLRILRI